MGRPLSIALLSALAPVACSSAQHDGPPKPAAEPPAFELRSGMWINLHQELLHHARSDWKWRHKVLPDRAADPAWRTAIDRYRERYAPLENLDPTLSALAVDLAASGSEPSPSAPPELRALLESAAESYRQGGWPEDDRRNREWIDRVTPLLDRFGAAMRDEIARANETTWPKGTHPIEVVAFVDPYGGQTTDQPAPITLISSADPGYAGDAALEMIFHEASHRFDVRLIDGVAEAARELGVPAPDGLWHAVLFYTAGYFAKQHLGPSYVPYADAHGLYDRGGWTGYRPILEAAWEPHLRGETSLHGALRSAVQKLVDCHGSLTENSACPTR